jgi:uncharacterized protein
MKILLSCIILCCLCGAALAQAPNSAYNQALADSLGADAYGMKAYVLVMLKTGSASLEDKERINTVFRGHLDNIGRLASEGKLVVAGPMGKNDKTYRGIFILNVATLEEAASLLETDPAVKEKLLEAELYSWYGSAALPAYLPVHDRIQKEKP